MTPLCDSDRPERQLAEHERLVHWVVRHQWRGGLSYTEAVQVGRLALWQALRRYNPTRGVAFSTYAVPAIARALWRAAAESQPDPRIRLTPQPPQTAPDLQEVLEQQTLREALHRAVTSLPPACRPSSSATTAWTGVPPRPLPPSAAPSASPASECASSM